MNKVIKRLTAAALAGVMAMSVAASASADTVCRHTHTTKTRFNSVSDVNSSHTIEYVVNGILNKANCSYHVTVFACSYVCDECHKKVTPTEYEQVEYHQNTKCQRYSPDGVIV